MSGLLLALATAGLFGVNASAAKSLSARGAEGPRVARANFLVATPLLLLFALPFGIPRLGPDFLPCLAATILLAAVGYPLYFSAIERTDLSIAVPLASLSPIFQIGTGWLLLGERPSPLGALGVAVATAGAYLLGLGPAARSPLDPLRALARDPGARCAIGVALVWAVGAPVDKRGVLASSPIFYMAAAHPFALAALLLLDRRGDGAVAGLRASPGRAAVLGATHAAMCATQTSAYLFLPAVYVAAIKRAGILVSLVDGARRGERAGRARAGAIGMLLAGVALVAAG